MGDPIGSYSRPAETWCLADFRRLICLKAVYGRPRIADHPSVRRWLVMSDLNRTQSGAARACTCTRIGKVFGFRIAWNQ
jgi:hypothetical protein